MTVDRSSASLKTVFIPAVSPGDSSGGQLLVLGCQPAAAFSREDIQASTNDSLKPVYADLASAGKALESAIRAYACVSALALRPPRFALYQRLFNRRLAFDRLRIVNLSGSRISEGQSADLGIALLLLMAAAKSRPAHGILIATGGIKPRPDRNDVEVIPVAAIPEKLRLIAERRRTTSELDGARLCFVPEIMQTPEGDWLPVRTLPELIELRELGIEVVPIRFLSEVSAKIGARATGWIAQDQMMMAGGLGLGVLGILMRLQAMPIPMAFVPFGGGHAFPAPFIVCTEHGSDHFSIKNLDELDPSVSTGETLGWSVRIGDPSSWLHRLPAAWHSYYLAQINVGEKSGIQVMTGVTAEDGAFRIRAGDSWDRHWRLGDIPESSLLVLLAQRLRPFDAEEIAQGFKRVFPPKHRGPSFLIEARNYLATLAPGALFAPYRLTGEPSNCATGQ